MVSARLAFIALAGLTALSMAGCGAQGGKGQMDTGPPDVDDAQAASKQAAANVEQQKAAAEAAQINPAYTRVTAPIGGRIGASSVTVGALVTADQAAALATIQRLDPIYVDVTQSASDEL